MGIYYMGSFPFDSDYLMHYGIKGQKWGIRRFQNPDGTLTEAGKQHYASYKEQKKFAKLVRREGIEKNEGAYLKAYEKEANSPQFKDAVAKLKQEAINSNNRDRDVEKTHEELYKHIYNNPNTYEKWLDKAVEKRMRDMDPDLDLWTKEEVKSWYRNDDGDQGDYGVFETYIHGNSKDPLVVNYRNAVSDSVRANKKLLSASKDYANIMLGEFKDLPIQNLYPWQTYRHKSNDILSYALSGNAKQKWKSVGN